MRTPLVAGNWKMNMTIPAAIELVKGIHYGLRSPGDVDVVVAPPLTALHMVAEFLKDSYIGVAAQNMHWEENGAYTGEVSGPFLRDAGADYVIVGHSERRQYFGESDDTVNRKTRAALRCGLHPIICVGETLEEREAGDYMDLIERQLTRGLAGMTAGEAGRIILAYEPVWAIGTGRTASPEQAGEVHGKIRSVIAGEFGTEAAGKVRILYGGSVKPANSEELLGIRDIDGALVGGASLKPHDFVDIIRSA